MEKVIVFQFMSDGLVFGQLYRRFRSPERVFDVLFTAVFAFYNSRVGIITKVRILDKNSPDSQRFLYKLVVGLCQIGLRILSHFPLYNQQNSVKNFIGVFDVELGRI